MSKAAALSVKESAEDLQEELEMPEVYLPREEDSKQELVLVVEDDKSSNKLLSVIIKDAGYSVATLYSGKNVLRVAKNLKPDIITLDVFLPDTNGGLVLKQLKNDPHTASILVFIIPMTNNNELGITLGATYSFTKPIKRVELVNSLKEITGKFRFEFPKVLMMPEISGFDLISSMRADIRTKDIPLIVCTSSELTGKNLEELNNELKSYLISIMKKGTFGRKELINRIEQLAMLKRLNDEENPYCRR